MPVEDDQIVTALNAVTSKVGEVHTKQEVMHGDLLQMKAEQDRDLAAAEEADKLSSAIAIQQISYRDIRDRRDAIKTLILSLRQDDRR